MAEPLKARVVRFFAELSRRKVYTSAVAYGALAMVLWQVAPPIFRALLKAPDAADRAENILTLLLLLFFPVVLVLAWVFDIGPTGVHRTPDHDATSDASRAHGYGAGQGWSSGDVEPEPEPEMVVPAPLTREAPDPNRVRRAALAFIRHELRTPINAIIGYSEMLTEDVREEGDTEAATDLVRITDSGRQLLRLVEEILDADRITKEQRDVDSYSAQIRADLRDPLSAVIGYTEMLIESRREKNSIQHVPDLERILSAAGKLLDNSSDIARLATRAPDAVPEVSRTQSLTEDVLSKIRSVAPGQSGQNGQSGQGDDDRQGSLLIVDDNPMNRDLLARQLARRGYLVATADNGQQALDRMREQEFDVVLLDVVMPELDGIEVLRRMQADRNMRDIPVIMISALDEIDSVIRCLEIGAADFLSKPFHPTLLDVRISACLASRRTRERERALRTQLTNANANKPQRHARLLGDAPASVHHRLEAGERVLDVTQHAAALWCDIDRAIPASGDPLRRATAVGGIVDAINAVAKETQCEILTMHTGIAVIAGFPAPASAKDAASRVAKAAILIHENLRDPQLRLGLHVGSINGAAVGSAGLSYWIWGEAIDLARRLSLAADAGTTFLSPAAHAELKDTFAFAKHGVIEVAGRGEMRPFLLQGAATISA